jgi:hypothetical protein
MSRMCQLPRLVNVVKGMRARVAVIAAFLVLPAAALALPAGALVFPGVALASTHPVIPVGNSGADQYIETVPSASGSRPTVNPGHPGSPAFSSGGPNTTAAGSALPGRTTAALRARGRDGRGAARFARATSPQTARHRYIAGGVSSGGGANPPAGSSPVGSVLGSLTGLSGAGGLGAALPVVLGLSAVWIAGLAIRRRRHAG